MVTQIVRTTFRADGTPIGKTLTVQGGSTLPTWHQKPEDVPDDEVLPAYRPADMVREKERNIVAGHRVMVPSCPNLQGGRSQP